MKLTTSLLVFALAVCSSYSQNAQPGQRFQAEKFLDMLGTTFEIPEAYMDLLAALQRRLKLDPIGQLANATGTDPLAGSSSTSSPDSSMNCPLLTSPMGSTVSYTNPSRSLASRALFQCDAGYTGSSLFVQCLPGGQWSSTAGWEGCKQIDCGAPPPNVVNADASFTSTTYGSRVFYNCRPGFKMTQGSGNVTCLDIGQWETPTFSCQPAQPTQPSIGLPGGMNLASLVSGLGGQQGAGQSPGGQNPMLAALLKNMGNMAGGGGMPGAGSMPNMPNIPGMSGGANNPMLAAIMSQISGNQQQPQQPPVPEPTTPAPPTNQFGQASNGGFQLPTHLQNLLPGVTQGINPRDLRTLTSGHMGGGMPPMFGGGMDISKMFGGSGGGMGMGPAGRGGKPADPEKMAEQREDMMMRAMMAQAMRSMMAPRQQQRPNGSNSTVQQQAPRRNPASDFMTMMALQSVGGGGSGGGMGAMDPASMFMQMNPSMLGMGSMSGLGGMANWMS